MRDRKALARQKRIEPLPLTESLERAFAEIERPAPKYADAPEARANTPGQERVEVEIERDGN